LLVDRDHLRRHDIANSTAMPLRERARLRFRIGKQGKPPRWRARGPGFRPPHQVPFADDADEFPRLIDDWNSADAVVEQALCRVTDRGVRRDRDHWRGHDVARLHGSCSDATHTR
jgi:hypothetical protein